jgi:hypothetical protein
MIRVTKVLEPYSNFDNVLSWVLENAQARGTMVHSACFAYAQRIWIPPLPEEYEGYALSFSKWFDRYVKEVIDIEPHLVDEDLQLVGHPDFILIMSDGVWTLPDLKTAAMPQKSWRGQMAAYRYLASKKWPKIERAGTLRLKRDGGPALFDPYMFHDEDWAAFCYALFARRYFLGEDDQWQEVE